MTASTDLAPSSPAARAASRDRADSLPYQAYQILHWGFAALPILAGADKFLGLLADWPRYLSPVVARIVPAGAFMHVVGVVEIGAGLLVAFKPRIGAYVVAAWLVGIILNLVAAGGYYDIAARDFGLALGALALTRLAAQFDRR